jgi:GT2 family glycosyltransferase
MDLSIVIVTWNNDKEIGRALRSVFSRDNGLKTEVIVVDNASTDRTRDEVAKFGTAVRTIFNPDNRGFAAANNQGLDISSGQFVLLLNPDTELVGAALEDTVSYLRKHPEAGIAGCKLLNFDGSLQPSVRRFPTWRDQAVVLLKLHNFFPSLVARYMAADFDYEKEQETDQVRGAYFCLTCDLIKKVGTLDERNFFNWFEEVDYCRRAKNSGFKVAYLPSVVCRHEGGASFAQALSLRKQRWLNRSMKSYFRKHGSLADRVMIFWLSPVSLVLAWVVGVFKIKPRKYV